MTNDYLGDTDQSRLVIPGGPPSRTRDCNPSRVKTPHYSPTKSGTSDPSEVPPPQETWSGTVYRRVTIPLILPVSDSSPLPASYSPSMVYTSPLVRREPPLPSDDIPGGKDYSHTKYGNCVSVVHGPPTDRDTESRTRLVNLGCPGGVPSRVTECSTRNSGLVP